MPSVAAPDVCLSRLCALSRPFLTTISSISPTFLPKSLQEPANIPIGESGSVEKTIELCNA